MTATNIVNTVDIDVDSKIFANHRITFQEEADRWAVLYDPTIDFSLGINPETAFLWKQLKYKTTVREIAISIKQNFSNVPAKIETDVLQLIKGLMKIGFVSGTV